MEIKEIMLNVKKIRRLADIIYKELKQSMDAQIFLDEAFAGEIQLFKPENYIFRNSFIDSGCHYKDDEMRYAFHEEACINSNVAARIHLVSNCKGYLQVCFFSTKDIKYRHYCQGMNKIVIIHAKH